MTTTATTQEQAVQIIRVSLSRYGLLTAEESECLLDIIDGDWTRIAQLERELYEARQERAQAIDNLRGARYQAALERDHARQAQEALRELRGQSHD